MKPLAIWLVIVAIVFGVYAAVTIALRETEQVFVVVDTSDAMEGAENEIRRELDRIDDRDDAEFALANASSRPSNSGLVHSWQSQLRWNGATLFGPCSFAEVDTFAEAADADERILVTIAGSCDTTALTDWQITMLDP